MVGELVGKRVVGVETVMGLEPRDESAWRLQGGSFVVGATALMVGRLLLMRWVTNGSRG